MRFHIALGILGCSSLFLAGCGGTDNNVENDLLIDRSSVGFVAYFSPANAVLPFPSNLLLDPNPSSDRTINIPVSNPDDYANPQVALNALDGFSTVAPMKTTFSQAIDGATLNDQTVHLFEVTLSGHAGAVIAVNQKLQYGIDFVAGLSPVDAENKTLSISPLKPLKPKTSYMVALTNAIQSTDGRPVDADIGYQIVKRNTPLIDAQLVSQVPILTDTQAQTLEPLRQLTNFQEQALAGASISSDIVVVSWTFTTQSIGDVLDEVKTLTASYGPTTAFNPTPIGTTAQLLGAGPGAADVYAGTLTLPYYLTNAATSTDPLNKFWQGAGETHLTQYNTTPIQTSDETVPVLLTIPGTGTGPWPIVIFQHGITQNRSNVLAVADSLASAGFAAIAIDLPLHGLPTDHDLYSGMERTFDLDFANNTTKAPTPDGIADTSGTHFINLKNLLVTRDNVRQSVADLFALKESLATLDYNNDFTLDIDTSNIHFLGHSLGGMVGTPFLAQDSDIDDAVLAMSGSGIAKLLDGSVSFGPVIAAGLEASGVIKGTAAYETFMAAAQTVIDSGDPANYAADAATGRGILLFEVVGDGGSNLPDQVIPNNVTADAPEGTVPAPLSGTSPFATLLDLTQVSASTTGSDLKSLVRFTAGFHGSILDPAVDPLANATTTTVMQEATATFMATDGTQVSISDTSVVE